MPDCIIVYLFLNWCSRPEPQANLINFLLWNEKLLLTKVIWSTAFIFANELIKPQMRRSEDMRLHGIDGLETNVLSKTFLNQNVLNKVTFCVYVCCSYKTIFSFVCMSIYCISFDLLVCFTRFAAILHHCLPSALIMAGRVVTFLKP